MNRYIFLLLIINLFTTGLSIDFVIAYDDKYVHKAINEKALRQSILDEVLKSVLGLPDGVNTFFNKQDALKWYMEGGELEDIPPRWLRHFHDPLKPWEDSGLFLDVSSILWAQYKDPWFDPYGLEKNEYSWSKAREYFHQALTTGSELEFALTFRALGQVMHLLADAAVPAHVRNDMHPFGDPYEGWAQKEEELGSGIIKWAKKNIENLDFTPCHVDLAIFSHYVDGTKSQEDYADYSLAPVPISALWDQNKYRGIDPEVTWGAPSEIGLAEYTNANFFSKDTIFGDYSYPAITSTALYNIDWTQTEAVIAEDGKADNRKYIWGYVGGGQNIRLAAGSYLSYDCIRGGYYSATPLVLDDKVHEDYALQLIPRAVGYSTALLDYFFRGQLEVTGGQVDGIPAKDSDGAIRWLTPISNASANISNISNLGTDMGGNPIPEPLGTGALTAVARYKTATPDFLYSVSEEIAVDDALLAALNSGTPKNVSFHFMNPVPAGAKELSLLIVFRGTLGAEKDIAVAVGRIDLPEGALEISFPDEYVYAIIDGSTIPFAFPYLKAKIRNTTETVDLDENPVPVEFTHGSLYAAAYYRLIPGLAEDLSNFPQDAATLQALMADVPFSTSISAPIAIDAATNPLPAGQGSAFTFDFSMNPVPAGVTDLYLAVYYTGGTDSASSDIIAIGAKDLSEPQHLTFWNDTDYFLLNGEPVKADDIRDDPDVRLYGYINPHRISEYLGFTDVYPSVYPVPLVEIDLLEPARHARMIVLTDNPAGYFVTDRVKCYWLDGSVWADNTWVYPLEAFINQWQPEEAIWQWTPVYTVRGIAQHQRSYYMNSYPYFVFIDSLPAPPENAEGAFPITINFP